MDQWTFSKLLYLATGPLMEPFFTFCRTDDPTSDIDTKQTPDDIGLIFDKIFSAQADVSLLTSKIQQVLANVVHPQWSWTDGSQRPCPCADNPPRNLGG